MGRRHELEMKAEEIFNMVFAPLGWDPDDDGEAKAIVGRAVDGGLMEMPGPDDMEGALGECARAAQEKMRDGIIGRVLSVGKAVIKTYTLAAGGPAYGVEIRYADCGGHGEVDGVLFWYQDGFAEKAYYSVPDGMQGLVLDVLGVEY